MRKFITIVIVFISPIFIYLLSIEIYCRTQTPFGIKKNYLESHLDSIELLILGSSHSQNALNPEFLNKITCNLAFGGQPISINYYLLDKYIDRMTNLQTVYLEVSTHSFYNDLRIDKWNGHIYSILYDIKYKVEPISWSNYSLVCSNYHFFSSLFIDYCNPYAYHYNINKFGFATNDFHDKFEKLKYDTLLINKTFKMDYTYVDRDNFEMNKKITELTVKRCRSKGINVVFITTPFYKTFSNHIPVHCKKEVESFIETLTSKYKIKYFDYSSDKRFVLLDFKNDNHLNSKGAEKFSKIINKEILQ